MCRDAVAAGKSLPLPNPPPDHPHWTCLDYFFRGLPEAQFSTALNAKLLELVATHVAIYDSLISEVEAREVDDEYLVNRTLRPVGRARYSIDRHPGGL